MLDFLDVFDASPASGGRRRRPIGMLTRWLCYGLIAVLFILTIMALR